MKKNKVFLSGNECMGEAAICAGCFFYAGYPITPQNELTAYMAKRMGEENRVFIQAESEISAINMVFGASLTGMRAMTSSSSPGISLKQEGISYLASAQLPCVIINVMRGGPGLGNIASSQSDYFQATRGGGHGDYYLPVFSPWSVEEAGELVSFSFDVADYYRTPVMILTDAIVAQMREGVVFPLDKKRSYKLPPKDWTLTGCLDRDPRIIRTLFLEEGRLEKHNLDLLRKWEKMRKNLQMSNIYSCEDVEYVIISYGSQARISYLAKEMLRERKIKIGLFRPISLWPYPSKKLLEVTQSIKKIFVVEQSLGQMVEDVRLTLPDKEIYFLGRAGGGIPTVEEIIEFVMSKIK